MSRTYSFCAMLNSRYSKENILLILENGAKFGCVYENCGPIDSHCDTITCEAATDLILSRLSKKYEFGPYISTIYRKTHFSVRLYNRNNKIYLCIGITHTAWKKKYDLSGSYGINFYRYQNFMLYLIGNNIITHFKTYECLNASYNPEDKEHDKKIYVKLYIYWPYDVYHHFKVNGKMLGITWLDENKEPINLKSIDNAFEDIFFSEDAPLQHWYGIRNNMLLKFSLSHDHTFIIEPMSIESSKSINQAELLDAGLRITIELFKNIHVFKLITFKNDEDILNINKMDY